jgi:hypothetical protein
MMNTTTSKLLYNSTGESETICTKVLVLFIPNHLNACFVRCVLIPLSSHPLLVIGTRVVSPLPSPLAMALANAVRSFWLSTNPSAHGSDSRPAIGDTLDSTVEGSSRRDTDLLLFLATEPVCQLPVSIIFTLHSSRPLMTTTA